MEEQDLSTEANYFCPICGFEGHDLVCPVCGEKMESLKVELAKIEQIEKSDDLFDDEVSLESEAEVEEKKYKKEENAEKTEDI